jgi:hypothetical protein
VDIGVAKLIMQGRVALGLNQKDLAMVSEQFCVNQTTTAAKHERISGLSRAGGFLSRLRAWPLHALQGPTARDKIVCACCYFWIACFEHVITLRLCDAVCDTDPQARTCLAELVPVPPHSSECQPRALVSFISLKWLCGQGMSTQPTPLPASHRPLLGVQKIGCKPQVINEYEQGKGIPDPAILSKISRVIKIKLTGKNIGEPLNK